jgi:ssDNA thymidine ADP-ribosyltransferase DarT-like protein
MPNLLSAEKALIFRITHRDNVPWILANGLHCRSSNRLDPNFVSIGNASLINDRQHIAVPIQPRGTLSNYVPFYFTPHSVMLLNIKTGYRGVQQRRNDEIVILVSSLPKLIEDQIRFVFTDRHARLAAADFFDDTGNLDKIDWKILRNRDFSWDENDLGKKERYQAEALVHRYLPPSSLLGIACYNKQECDHIDTLVREAGLDLRVISQPGWYF